MSRRPRPQAPRVNFVTPPKRERTGPNPTLLTVLFGTLALAIGTPALLSHQQLAHATAELRAQEASETRAIAELATTLEPRVALEHEAAAAEARIATLTRHLPPQLDWGRHLTTITERLPGIGSYNPAIVLGTIEAASGEAASAAAFGADPATTAPIALTITLSGQARERDAVTHGVEAYERDSHLLTRFPGTTATSEGRYDFRIDLAFLATHPTLNGAPQAAAQGTP